VDFRANIKTQLESYRPYYCGDELASIIAIKGKPGAAELEHLAPFSGDDGLALDKSFGQLGWGYGSKSTRIWLGILLSPLTLPRLTAEELRYLCEVVDPLTIVALDEPARVALTEAFSSTETGLLVDFHKGTGTEVLGRHFVSVDGFEDALADDSEKQRVWAELKQARRTTA
jgi:hypothetical protein